VHEDAERGDRLGAALMHDVESAGQATPSQGRDETSPRYAGWRVVLACFLMAQFLFAFGLYGQSLYLTELHRLNGWPIALISGAGTLSLVICNMLATFTNEFLVWFGGPKRLSLAGLAALAASAILLASATTPLQLYVAFTLMSLSWVGMGTVVMATVLSKWFMDRRGLALSLAFTGASFGGAVLTPLLVLLVDRVGFAPAMLTATAVMAAILVPVIIAWIGSPPAADSLQPPTAPTPGATSRAALARRPAFWSIAIPFSLALVAQIGFIVHLLAIVEPKIGRAGAGFAISLMSFMAIAGRLGLGAIVDRFNPRLVAAASVASQGLALLIVMQADSTPVVLLACAIFGCSAGNLITLPPLIISREFNDRDFAVVLGLANAISGTLGALGPGLLGLAQGWTGDYGLALGLCIALDALAAAILVGRALR
jgi:MFS family permease